MRVPSSAPRTHLFHPPSGLLPATPDTETPTASMHQHQRAPHRACPRACCPRGGGGAHPSPQGARASSGRRADDPPRTRGARLRRCRLRLLQTVCIYIRSISTTCNGTLLVFLHNSIPPEPHNILLIALGLETYFASKAAAMDRSFACCW